MWRFPEMVHPNINILIFLKRIFHIFPLETSYWRTCMYLQQGSPCSRSLDSEHRGGQGGHSVFGVLQRNIRNSIDCSYMFITYYMKHKYIVIIWLLIFPDQFESMTWLVSAISVCWCPYSFKPDSDGCLQSKQRNLTNCHKMSQAYCRRLS